MCLREQALCAAEFYPNMECLIQLFDYINTSNESGTPLGQWGKETRSGTEVWSMGVVALSGLGV